MIDQTQPNSNMDQFDRGIDLKLFHDFSAVRFYRTDADIEYVGNLACRMPFGNKLENFSLPVGQLFVTLDGGRPFFWGKIVIHEHL